MEEEKSGDSRGQAGEGGFSGEDKGLAGIFGGRMVPGKWTVRAFRLVGSLSIVLGAAVGLAETVEPARFSSIMIVLDAYKNLVAELRTDEISKFVVQEELSERISRKEMPVADGVEIVRDLMRLDGMFYNLPELEVLKTDLGFPREAKIEPQDLGDLVKSHLQLVFEMNPLTASYIAGQLKVHLFATQICAAHLQSDLGNGLTSELVSDPVYEVGAVGAGGQQIDLPSDKMVY